MNKTEDTVKKLINALAKNKGGYAFATGYLESTLVDIIETYVPEDKRVMVQIELLGRACNLALDNYIDNAPAA